MEIADYKKVIEAHNPCAVGLAELQGGRTRHDVFSCLIDRNNTDYLLASMRDGWGPAPADITRVFDRHLNGPVQDNVQVWCEYSGDITLAPSVKRLVLIGCGEVLLNLPAGAAYLKVQTVGKETHLTIAGGDKYGFVQVRRYSGEVRVESGADIRIYDR